SDRDRRHAIGEASTATARRSRSQALSSRNRACPGRAQAPPIGRFHTCRSLTMDATALAVSTPAIQMHAGAAIAAFVLGTLVLLMKKGTRLHKAMGRVWVALMVVVALSSFVITEVRMFGPYSLIHALSLFTLVGLVQAVRAIRRGDVKAHRAAMIGLYGGALI